MEGADEKSSEMVEVVSIDHDEIKKIVYFEKIYSEKLVHYQLPRRNV